MESLLPRAVLVLMCVVALNPVAAATQPAATRPASRPAEPADEPTTNVRLTVIPPKDGLGYTAELTNRTDKAIAFTAYLSDFANGKATEPVQVLHGLERWVPEKGWVAGNIGWCGTGAGGYRLEPGKTVKLVLHVNADAEFVRVTLRYAIVDAAEKSTSQAVSNVVRLVRDK